MLLECNEIKLLIVNLDTMSDDLDTQLPDLISFRDCIFILANETRAEQLQEDNEDFTYTSPRKWFGFGVGFSNSLTISKILRENNIESYEAVYITGDSHEAYNDLGVSTVLLSDEDTELDKNNLPDHHITDIPTLIKCLEGKRYGYFGELCADGSGGRGGFLISTLSNELVPSVETDLVVFGRYFVSHDSRAYIHPLSQMILQMKSGKQKQVKFVANLFADSVNHLNKNGLLEEVTITSVPPKLNKRNILLEVLNKSKDLGKSSLNSDIEVAELLQLKENYKPQKDAGNHTNRFLNVKGKFESNKKVSGHIVLVDDIITSGATALECAKVLYKAGADKVTVLTFGASQNRSTALPLNHLKCEKCENGKYKIKFGSNAFYGCSEWPNCNSTLEYKKVRKLYNASRKMQQNSSLFDDDEEF